MSSKCKFYLRDRNTDPSAIILRSYICGRPFTYGVGRSIDPDLWNNEIQRAKTDKKSIMELEKFQRLNETELSIMITDLKNINTRIDNMEKYFAKIRLKTELEGSVDDPKDIRHQLNEKYRPNRNIVKDHNFIPFGKFLEQFINDIRSGKQLINYGRRKGKRYELGTIKNYEGFRNRLIDFQEHPRRLETSDYGIITIKFNYEDITLGFYNRFVDYLASRNYSRNTIGRHVKSLKVVMRLSRDEGYHVNEDFERREFETLTQDVTSVYLTEEEVDRLASLDLSQEPHYELARDIFLCGVYTALRYSDYSRIKPHHIKERDGKQFLEMITMKLSEKVIIPIRPQLRAILDRYDQRLPRTWPQKLNQYIKVVARKAEITEPIEVEQWKGGRKVIKRVPKCDLISSHCARRTAATLWYQANISPVDIMNLTTHTSERNFRKYICISREETAARLSMHPYFNRMKVVK